MTGVQTCALPICMMATGIVDVLEELQQTEDRDELPDETPFDLTREEIGRASCRERV